MKIKSILISGFIAFLALSCSQNQEPELKSGDLTLVFNDSLYTKVEYKKAKEPLTENFQPSEILKTDEGILKDFQLKDFELKSYTNKAGSGQRLTLTGISTADGDSIEKKVIASTYDEVPDFITTRVVYTNKGKNEIAIKGWKNNNYKVQSFNTQDEQVDFWSFQTGTYPSRPDWVLPVKDDFQQQNYLGMNASDYGGGTPVSDLWRPDAGLAIGHLELNPKLISLPVTSKGLNGGAEIAVQFDVDSVSQQKYKRSIAPGDSMATFQTFVSSHTGDYFTSLRKYRKVLKKKGMRFSDPPETAYEPIWCAWGYGRDFTLQKVINTLPKVKELGFEWVVLDDGWQIAEGDWRTNNKFDDLSMKAFVDSVHSYGLKAKLWWAPLAADPGSRMHEKHPELLLKNKKGNYQKITWWDSHYMNPALKGTQTYHTGLVKKFMDDWGFDGLKIDGQHLNNVPPDYGHSEEQKNPEESVEQLPSFYKKIYDTAKNIKSDAVVEICPCGASASSFIMPYMNQSVASDPLDSWQIRLKGKTYKALMGVDAAYYGDHVELSDNQNDFASTVGVGGVVGTKFTWPKSNSDSDNEFLLTDQKEKLVSKWMNIYQELMLPKGEYRGRLYDIGYDRPEAHAIEKDGRLYYAFYADSFDGKVELRGLKEGQEYELTNYETGKKLGTVTGPKDTFDTTFKDHLMLVAKSSEDS